MRQKDENLKNTFILAGSLLALGFLSYYEQEEINRLQKELKECEEREEYEKCAEIVSRIKQLKSK